MTKTNTLGCTWPAAVICRANGWDVGALLRADALPKETGGARYVRLTAVGESQAVGVGYHDDGSRWGTEGLLREEFDLSARDWRLVAINVGCMNDEALGRLIRKAESVLAAGASKQAGVSTL